MVNEELFSYSLRNLKHKKGRSFLTIFSIMIGIATIFIFVSYGWGLYDYTESFTTSSSADKLLIMAKGAGVPGTDDSITLNDDDLKVIKRAAGVYDATGDYMNVVEVKKAKETVFTYIVSYDPSKPLVMDLFGIGIEKGRELRSGDRGAVFGYNYMVPGKIFDSPLDINDVVKINEEKIKVIGFMEPIGNPADDTNIYITNDNFKELYPEKKSYTQIIAKVDLTNIEGVTENIERGLRKLRNLEKGKEDFYVQSFEDMIESFSGAINVIIAFVILIALVSVLVSAVNTANTMITSVLERYKEIGILKAIGARNNEVFTIFLFESAFLGVLAGTLGVLFGYFATEVASKILTNLGWGFLSPHYSPWLFAGCILFAGITGAISGVIPSIKASKINTVEALRYE